MSQHAHLSPEAEQKLRAQKRNSTISAIIISLLASALLVAILFFIALTPLFKNTEELVTYSSSNSESEEQITKPEMTDQVKKKPSSPSSSMAKAITSSTPSPTAVPVPDVTVAEPSLDFGDGDDFGDGWGGSGDGAGSSGGDVSFFQQSVKAERIAYVIDYSASMKGKKLELMKKELSKSVKDLPDGIEYQLIFFAGPAWIGGDEIEGTGKGGKLVTIRHNGRKSEWKTGKNKPKMPKGEWLKSGLSQRKESLKHIKETPMVYGTAWRLPLTYALEMDPKPDIIFFMTDGTSGSNSDGIGRLIGTEAAKKGVIINSVALMEPKAKVAMGLLAELTGGVFTEVQADGKTIQHDLGKGKKSKKSEE